MSFTPGPWKVESIGDPRVLATDAKGDFPVCDIRGWGHLTGKGHGALGLPEATAIQIQDANARLIAAAPDLLAALKKAAAIITGENTSKSLLIDALEQTRAALSKAEGHIGQELAPGESAQ